MKDILLTIVIGLSAGIIDILPMIKMKQDKYSIVSAFVFYLTLPFIVFSSNLFGMAWWLKGGVFSLVLALPVIFIVMKTDKRAIPPIMTVSIVLGTIIGIVGHALEISLS